MSKQTTDDLKKIQSNRPGRGGNFAMMAATGGKAKNFKKTLRHLIEYLRCERWKLMFVTMFAIISTILSIAGPKIAANATNKIEDYFIENTFYSQTIKKLPSGLSLPSGLKLKDLPSFMLKSAYDQIDNSPEIVATRAQISKLPTLAQINENKVLSERIASAKSSAATKIKPAAESITKSINQFSGDQKTTIENMDLTKKPQMDFGYIWWNIVVLLSGLYLFSALLSFVQGVIAAGITQRLAYRLRDELGQKINKLPLAYFDSRQFGDVLSRITNDVDLVQQTMSQSLSTMIWSFVMIVGIPIMMFTISWQMALIALAIIPTSMIFIMLITKKSQGYFLAQQEVLGKLDGHIEEVYSGHSVVKAFGGENNAIKKFALYNEELRKSAWKSQFLSGLMIPATTIIGDLGYVGVALMGGWLAITRGLGVGDILAFIQYLQQFNQPINQLSQTMNMVQPMAAAAERVFEFLTEPDEIADPIGAKKIATVRGAVEFNGVKFSYTPGAPIIKNLNAKIKPGETVAIVGPTGAGKTTIANLLMRFYDPDSGEIKIDGVNTREMKRADVRKEFAMVLQDTWLFHGTIRENLTYGKHNATDDEIRKIAQMTNVDHFIQSLPDGYDTILDEDAENISAGEKQLLTIARAMLTDPPMLILDEATSNVDTRTEVRIQQAMLRLMKGRTSFVIAHRLSTIRNADLILVINHGDIIESGNHESLLARNGFYARLYNSQFNEPSEEY